MMNYYKNAIDLNVKYNTSFKTFVCCVGFTHIDFKTYKLIKVVRKSLFVGPLLGMISDCAVR